MAERVKPLRELLKTQKAGATGILTPVVSAGGTSAPSFQSRWEPLPFFSRLVLVCGRSTKETTCGTAEYHIAFVVAYGVDYDVERQAVPRRWGVRSLSCLTTSECRADALCRFEKSDQAKARQQAEGNRRLEDVIVIYRTIIAHGGTGTSPGFCGGIGC